MAAQFGDPNGMYVLAFPQGRSFNGLCGAHGYGPQPPGTRAYYIFIPYQTDGNSCGNTLDTASWVAGHELAEVITDPIPYTGWVGPAGEIGDECQDSRENVSLSGVTFYMQALWSNATGSSDPGTACVFSSPNYASNY